MSHQQQAQNSSQLRHELEEKERRLERERRVLQKQGHALLKMPVRKEREELAALQVRTIANLGMGKVYSESLHFWYKNIACICPMLGCSGKGAARQKMQGCTK